jgi:hypothetical protein
MRICCNSLILERTINKVLKRTNNSIKNVKISHNKISFGRIKIQTEDNLSESYCDEFPFIPIRWYRIMKFLKYIPEQPITLTIYDDAVEIYCVAFF